jgi:metal-sulfur cluster biosynthetic enzyme
MDDGGGMEDAAPMYDNPAPVVYDRAAPAGGDAGGSGRAGGDGEATAASLAAGARLPASRAQALAALRRSAATFGAPGPWEAAFDPVAAGVGGGGGGGGGGGCRATKKAAAADATKRRRRSSLGGGKRDPIDAREVFDLVRDIRDPEHPYTLEQLGVVSPSAVRADDARGTARVDVTPTVEHCSMATLIGLCVRARLEAALPPRFKVRVRLARGSHATEQQVNRQLADKERVAAAMENARLRAEVERCLAPPGEG